MLSMFSGAVANNRRRSGEQSLPLPLQGARCVLQCRCGAAQGQAQFTSDRSVHLQVILQAHVQGVHLKLLQQQLREALPKALPSLTAALSADLQAFAQRYAALAGRHTTCHALNSLMMVWTLHACCSGRWAHMKALDKCLDEYGS